MGTRQLVYLYVGSSDVGRDLGFYRDRLGGELVWRSEGIGAEVAAVRLGEGPLVLLADHRHPPSAVLVDPSGTELALLERVRPGVMEERRG